MHCAALRRVSGRKRHAAATEDATDATIDTTSTQQQSVQNAAAESPVAEEQSISKPADKLVTPVRKRTRVRKSTQSQPKSNESDSAFPAENEPDSAFSAPNFNHHDSDDELLSASVKPEPQPAPQSEPEEDSAVISPKPKSRGRGRPSKNNGRSSRSSMKYDKNRAELHSYSDPDDVDDNPLLLDCYKPSLVRSSQLLDYVGRHLKTFGKYHPSNQSADLSINQAMLCSYLSTTGGTLSGMLSRKYPFKARGIIQMMRQWLSSRDRLIVSTLYEIIQDMYLTHHPDLSLNESISQSINQSDNGLVDPDAPLELEPVDWSHPCMQSVNLSLIASQIRITVDELTDFMQFALSIEGRGRVENIVAAWMENRSIRNRSVQANGQISNESLDESINQSINQSPINEPTRRRTRNQGKRQVKRELIENGGSGDDSDASFNQSTNQSINQSSDESDNEVEITRSNLRARRRVTRMSMPSHLMYPSKRNEMLTINQSIHQSISSPFTHPSWQIHAANLPINQFDPSPYTHPDYQSVHFQAPDGLVYQCPAFQSINPSINPSTNQSINQSDNQSINQSIGDYCFNVGGALTAMEWCPLSNKQTINQSINQRQLLTIAADHKNKYHNKYRSVDQSTNQLGLIQIWSLPPVKIVYDQIHNVSDNQSINQSNNQSINHSLSQPFLALVITHDHGDVRSMTWLNWNDWQPPINLSINPSNSQSNNQSIPRIGVLAATFGDGTALIVAIPQPQSINQSINQSITIPSMRLVDLPHAYFRMPSLFNPLINQSVNQSAIPLCLSFSSRAPNIAIGMSDSAIYTYSLINQQAINQSINQSITQSIKQSSKQSIHPVTDYWVRPGDYGIRSIDWNPTHPSLFVCTTNDGFLLLFDQRSINQSALLNLTIGADPVVQVRWLGYSINQSDTQSINQSINHSTNRADCLLIAFAHSIRVIFLLKQSDRFIPYQGMFTFPSQSINQTINQSNKDKDTTSMINQFDVIQTTNQSVNRVESNQSINQSNHQSSDRSDDRSDTESTNQATNQSINQSNTQCDPAILLTFASSDGSVNCLAHSLQIIDKDRTSHLVRTYGASVTKYTKSINQSNSPTLSISNSWPVVDCKARETRTIRDQRIASQAKNQSINQSINHPAVDDVISQRCVTIQKAFEFPRVIASGGINGIIRVQTITCL